MIDSILYYLDFYATTLIALCGFDGNDGNNIVGWLAIGFALALVIYATYLGITRAIWPGESDPSHIKYSILDDEEQDRAY